MAAEILEWAFLQEIDTPSDLQKILVPGENPIASYKTVRDTATLTNKRIIIRDVQGLIGKKVETYSYPWKSIEAWSSENAGTIDLDAELEFWMKSGHFKIKVNRKADVAKFDRIISELILG